MNLSPSKRWLWTAFVIAFLLRVAGGLAVDQVTSGAYGFRDYAANLLAGHGYVWDYTNNKDTLIQQLVTFRPPLYTLLYTALLWTFGAWSPGYVIVQALISATVPILLYRVAGTCFNELAGRIAAGAATVYPHFITRPGNVSDDNLFLPILCLILLFALRFGKEASTRNLLWLGFWTGMAMLTRQTIASYIPLVGLYILWRHRRVMHGLLFGVVVVLVITPWMMVHYTYYGSFSLSDATGRTLWVGNNALTYHSGRYPEQTIDLIEKDLMRSLPQHELSQIKSLPTHEQDRVFLGKAVEYVRSDPMGALTSIWLKNRGLFGLSYNPQRPGAGDSLFQARQVVHWVSYVPLLLLALVGAYRTRYQWQSLLPLHLLILSFVLISWVFWSHTRHAISYHSVWIVFASYVISEIFMKVTKNRMAHAA